MQTLRRQAKQEDPYGRGIDGARAAQNSQQERGQSRRRKPGRSNEYAAQID